MSRIRRTTIHDVARASGVGTTTVSRVINGGKLVAPRVRVRVEEVIRELGYQPSHAARSLAQEHTQSIGLIVPRLTDPFFSLIASAVQRICRANRHTLLISTSLDVEEQALEELAVFEQQRVDGLIVVPPARQTTLFREYCRKFSDRIIAVDLPIGSGFSSVQTDNAHAMAKATKHLIEHGRKRILFIGSDPELHTIRERQRGYAEAMARARLEPIVCEKLDSFEAVEGAILQAYKGKPGIDGIVAANSTLGIYAFQVLQKHRISIPSRVAFITFDDFALADTLRPSVTCVAQPIEQLGRVGAEMLFAQLVSPQSRSRNVQLPSELLIRESCGCKRRS